MNSSTSRTVDKRREKEEIKRKIELLKAQLDDSDLEESAKKAQPDHDTLKSKKSSEAGNAGVMLAPATPSPRTSILYSPAFSLLKSHVRQKTKNIFPTHTRPHLQTILPSLKASRTPNTRNPLTTAHHHHHPRRINPLLLPPPARKGRSSSRRRRRGKGADRADPRFWRCACAASSAAHHAHG